MEDGDTDMFLSILRVIVFVPYHNSAHQNMSHSTSTYCPLKSLLALLFLIFYFHFSCYIRLVLRWLSRSNVDGAASLPPPKAAASISSRHICSLLPSHLWHLPHHIRVMEISVLPSICSQYFRVSLVHSYRFVVYDLLLLRDLSAN